LFYAAVILAYTLNLPVTEQNFESVQGQCRNCDITGVQGRIMTFWDPLANEIMGPSPSDVATL